MKIKLMQRFKAESLILSLYFDLFQFHLLVEKRPWANCALRRLAFLINIFYNIHLYKVPLPLRAQSSLHNLLTTFTLRGFCSSCHVVRVVIDALTWINQGSSGLQKFGKTEVPFSRSGMFGENSILGKVLGISEWSTYNLHKWGWGEDNTKSLDVKCWMIKGKYQVCLTSNLCVQSVCN